MLLKSVKTAYITKPWHVLVVAITAAVLQGAFPITEGSYPQTHDEKACHPCHLETQKDYFYYHQGYCTSRGSLLLGAAPGKGGGGAVILIQNVGRVCVCV